MWTRRTSSRNQYNSQNPFQGQNLSKLHFNAALQRSKSNASLPYDSKRYQNAWQDLILKSVAHTEWITNVYGSHQISGEQFNRIKPFIVSLISQRAFENNHFNMKENPFLQPPTLWKPVWQIKSARNRETAFLAYETIARAYGRNIYNISLLFWNWNFT